MRWMKAVTTILAVVAALFIGLLLLQIAGDRHKRQRIISEVKASYMWRASRGEVAVPANPEALRCYSRSSMALPYFVEVNSALGETLTYIAYRTTNSGVALYGFRYDGKKDAHGNHIKEAPHI